MSRVFLGNLPSDCRVEDIEDFFRDFGKVTHFISEKYETFLLQVRNVLIKHGKFGFAEFDRDRWKGTANQQFFSHFSLSLWMPGLGMINSTGMLMMLCTSSMEDRCLGPGLWLSMQRDQEDLNLLGGRNHSNAHQPSLLTAVRLG